MTARVELRAVGVSAETLARHANAAGLATLEDVLRWGGHVLEVIVQDEYTHDVIVQAPRARGDDGYLVFDTT